MSEPAHADDATPAPPPASATAPAEAPPPPPAVAGTVFGDRVELAAQYVRLLADQAVLRGLIGPREVPRLWERHLLNCALVADLLPSGARVADVGSGAGLPGLVLAIRRPDLTVDLVEPLQRRTTFLEEVVRELGLGDSVRVVRGRADAASVRSTVAPVRWVVARAVAPLEKLASWCLPLLAPGGQLLAMKGTTVDAAVAEYRAAPSSAGSVEIVVVESAGVAPVRVAVVTASRRLQERRR